MEAKRPGGDEGSSRGPLPEIKVRRNYALAGSATSATFLALP